MIKTPFFPLLHLYTCYTKSILFSFNIYSPDATAVLRAGFGVGSGLINLDDVQCTGSEAALINCPYDTFTFDCSHVEDAGVRCSLTRMFIQ